MTIAIPSYNRRRAVTRLVAALDRQARRRLLVDGLDIVVVLDGSDDRSAEALENLELDVPLRIVQNTHKGPAATRNRLLDETSGDVVFFLDDDVDPTDELIGRHRTFHETTAGSLLMGPCLYPPNWTAPPGHAQYWTTARCELGARGRLERFQDFSVANTSGPTEVFRRYGGFDEAFTTYGPEDLELGFRLLDNGVPVRYDPDAVVWHRQERAPREACRLAISEGENYVRLVVRHPEAIVAVPLEHPSRGRRALGMICGRSPWRYTLTCRLMSAPLAPAVARTAPGRLLMKWSSTAGLLAGLFAQDPSGRIAGRLFGRG